MGLIEEMLNTRVQHGASDVVNTDFIDVNRRLSQAVALEDRMGNLKGVTLPPDKKVDPVAQEKTHVARLKRS